MIASKNRNDWGTYNKRYDLSDLSSIRDGRGYGMALYTGAQPARYQSIDETPPIELKSESMSGEGFIDRLKEKLKKLPKYVSKAEDLYSGNIGTALRNMIPDSDENARSGFAGEKHAILKLESGKNGVANYMGPGTSVMTRLKRNDPGRSNSDRTAKRHDIDYMLAQGEKTKEAQLIKIREADNRMIKSLQKIREDKSDAPRNIQMGMRLIQAKKLGEDFGILDKSKFAGELVDISKDDLIILKRERDKSQQEGYGIDGKLLPGQKLKMSILKKKLGGEGKKKYCSMGKGLSLPGRGYVSVGTGSVLAGGADDIISKLTSDVIPEVLKFVKTQIPKNQIGNLVNKFLDNVTGEKGIKEGIFQLSKELVPMMIMYKLKQSKLNPTVLHKMGVFDKALSGSGLKLAGRGMKGTGILDSIRALMGNAENKVDTMLGNAIWGYIKGMMKGTGNLKGSGFWSDFANGFKTGFVKTLDLIALPLSLIAPELAPAIGIGKEVGKLLPGKMLI